MEHHSTTSIDSYSDFLVNEISTDGSIVHLTDLSCPDFDQSKSTPLIVSLLKINFQCFENIL